MSRAGHQTKNLDARTSPRRLALQGARVVLIEVLFVEIYQGCHLFPDVLRLLGECGYTLYTLCGLHYGNHDELLWADAIFINSASHGRVLPSTT